MDVTTPVLPVSGQETHALPAPAAVQAEALPVLV
jgi:hypothetical protein